MNKYPILTFHSIDRSGSVISMPPPDFARIMKELAEAGWRGCTVGEALAVWGSSPGDQRLVAVSFDDGYLNLRDEAFPVLRDLGFTATVFVVARRCGENNRWPGQESSIPTMRLLDWPDLARLQQAGWEVGSHGLDHLTLTALGRQRAGLELAGARELLENNLGAPVRLFAYPYGAHNETVRELTRGVYDAACGTRLALASDADVRTRFEIPRIDAYYLRRFSAPRAIDSRAGRAYLALRRWARSLRSAPGVHSTEGDPKE